ncbi:MULTISPECIES: hypothetical protein [Bacillus]|uniref:hypothetical protein n=1 Tax=Bacillus TaxID=1386 RepID=UPI00036A1A06|nr:MULTISPECIES: hypothetical protein [Bacillus]MED1436926.1 hypothetical protein [Bacillus mycoides]MED1473195.1 hypothetical protein [Bacillus pseudomycoides]
MKKAIKEYADKLLKDAKVSKELADKTDDLTLSAYHIGMSTVLEGIAMSLEDILANRTIQPIENNVYEITQLLAEAKENGENGN